MSANSQVLLAHPLSAWAVIIATDVWKNTPFMTLMLLAGLRKAEATMEPLDMAAIVAEAQQRLSRTIDLYHAEIILPAAWPEATGYAPWVEGVWVNYISNAIKYAGVGKSCRVIARLSARQDLASAGRKLPLGGEDAQELTGRNAVRAYEPGPGGFPAGAPSVGSGPTEPAPV